MKTVNILGTEYTIETHKISEDEILKKENWAGYCGKEEIVIADTTEKEYFPYMSDKEQVIYRKEILRHEIVHAFLNESGLCGSTNKTGDGWAYNEEMIDWIAIQSPKIFKAYQEADCL